MSDDAYRQLMKHARRLAMDGHGELAQMLRDALSAALSRDAADKRSDEGVQPEDCTCSGFHTGCKK